MTSSIRPAFFPDKAGRPGRARGERSRSLAAGERKQTPECCNKGMRTLAGRGELLQRLPGLRIIVSLLSGGSLRSPPQLTPFPQVGAGNDTVVRQEPERDSHFQRQ